MSFMSELKDLQFVDTNILIYAHDISAGQKHIRARELIRSLWDSGEGCLSIQVLQEFYVNVTQKVEKPLGKTEAAQIISDLGVWDVHRPTVDDIQRAIRLQIRYQTSFWDAMILASATQMGCQTIWSEDLNVGQKYGSATVISPFES
jgi:predicted nucleic acid-binding protein